MKDQKKELPFTVYVNEPAIKNDRKKLENLVEVIGEFSSELERDEVLLDDKLLDQFVQNGPVAIADRIVKNSETGMAMSLLREQMFAGARRTANKYEIFYRKVEKAIHEAGVSHNQIAMLNGRPSLRGNLLEEIKQRHTIIINNEQDLEFYEKLSNVVGQFNELRDWIRNNRPDEEDLVDQTIIALSEFFFVGDEIASESDYLINKPNETRDSIILMVNPLYFQS